MLVWRTIDKLIFFVMSTAFAIVKKDYTADAHSGFMQFVKFAVVGMSNVIVSYTVYVTSLLIFRKEELFSVWDYQMAQILGFIVSVFWAFCLNRKLVFKTKKAGFWNGLSKFYLSYAFTGLFLNALLLYCWKSIGVSEFIAPFINIIFTTPINFLINKQWTFKKS